ncbi:MAG TPA: hypothetical protein VMZ28_11355, partial [Kofleriaceae bacterium]|nr:hypothetical protein [Kofleriaceae bacterium]
MRRARRAAALVAVLAAAGGCSVPAVFPCQVDAECRVGETQGRCEPAGYCSLPDGDCDSGYRFVEESPGSIAGECVAEDGGGGCDVDPEAPGCSEEVGCAVAIASGASHTCSIDQAGDVWCWGEDGDLRLGSSGGATEEPRQVTGLSGAAELVAAGGAHTCAVVDGLVYCWGANDAGQLGRGATGSAAPAGDAVEDVTGVHALATGDRHACVSDFDDTVYCWGANDADQVNEGEPAAVSSPSEVSGILQCAIGLGAGARHSAAVFEDGVVRTWGEADSPARGRGDVAGPGYAEIVVDSFDARSV